MNQVYVSTVQLLLAVTPVVFESKFFALKGGSALNLFEFDLDAALWLVPAARMKQGKAATVHGKPHAVPLPTQAVQTLRELNAITGSGEFVFRGERHHDRPMSENIVNASLRAMGFGADEVVGHGFRATAQPMMAERLGLDGSVIEAQRHKLMQTWADYLDRLRKGGTVLKTSKRAA